MHQIIEDIIFKKQEIMELDICDFLRDQMLRNLDWAIIAINMGSSAEDRKRYRDMVSKKIKRFNPHVIKNVSCDEVKKEVNSFLVTKSGKGQKYVFVIESNNEEVNDMVLFYE